MKKSILTALVAVAGTALVGLAGAQQAPYSSSQSPSSSPSSSQMPSSAPSRGPDQSLVRTIDCPASALNTGAGTTGSLSSPSASPSSGVTESSRAMGSASSMSSQPSPSGSASSADSASGTSSSGRMMSQSARSASSQSGTQSSGDTQTSAERALPRQSDSGSAGTMSGGSSTGMSSNMGRTPVEGKIANLNTASQSLEIGSLTLKVDPSTAVLVDCKPASMAELKEGAPVKAAYEERDGRNVATVIEVRTQ
jgi:hypothetical protein